MSTAKLNLRIKSKKSQNSIIRDIDVNLPLGEFLKRLSDVTDVPWDSMALLKGFPPKKILYQIDQNVASLDLRNQDTLIVEFNNDLHECTVAKSQGSLGCSGETSNLTRGTDIINSSTRPQVYDNSFEKYEAPMNDLNGFQAHLNVQGNGILMRKVVPADNSCLFRSILFCVNGYSDEQSNITPEQLRNVIAHTVAENKSKYNTAYLGKANGDYVNWIRNPNSWGGGIEVKILSDYYNLEIIVVDIQSLHASRFGEDKNYESAILLLYDGIHYDPLYLEPFHGGRSETIFSSRDPSIIEKAMELGREAKTSLQFTDLKNFALRCNQCNKLLKGEVEAQAHAKATSHTDFIETRPSV